MFVWGRDPEHNSLTKYGNTDEIKSVLLVTRIHSLARRCHEAFWISRLDPCRQILLIYLILPQLIAKR